MAEVALGQIDSDLDRRQIDELVDGGSRPDALADVDELTNRESVERCPDGALCAIELEAFLDTSILLGFSYGVDKANIAYISGDV